MDVKFYSNPATARKQEIASNNNPSKRSNIQFDRRTSFPRGNAAVLGFGLLQKTGLEPQVVNIEPAHKNLAAIPRGSHYNEQAKALDVGYFSTADSVDLCLFKRPYGENEVVRIPMKRDNSRQNMWVHSIPQDTIQKYVGTNLEDKNSTPVYYGYRVKGKGEYQDYKKLLTDDHTLATSHTNVTKGIWEDGEAYADKTIDTGKFAPKSIYSRKLEEISKPDKSPRLLLPVTDHVIYEAFVPGLTGGLGDILTRKDKIELAKKLKTENQSLTEKLQLLTSEEIKQAEKEKLAKKLGKKSPELVTDADLKAERESLAKERLKRIYKGIPGTEGLAEKWKDEYTGTYLGATFMIPYLKNMGVTMVEFMPIMEFQTSDTNDWGYMTDYFLAPKRDYAYDKNTPEGPTAEFKEMVKAFNRAGMEICMDVVFNHTGEGGTYKDKPGVANINNLRGAADSEYYMRWIGDPKYYSNSSGCGNDINPNSKASRELVVNSLKRFRNLGVSAFRFDLAPIIANANQSPCGGVNFDPNHPMLKAIEEIGLKPTDGGRKGIVWIAEPWGGDYAQGRFPHSWNEWNGQGARNTIRRAINKLEPEKGRPSTSEIIQLMCGSKEKIYGGSSPRSINFATAHDGFTLYDVFAYNDKLNYRTDGGAEDENFGWNQYWDNNPADINYKDPYDIPYPFSRRENAIKTALSLLMVSAGTPMMLYGDERAHTKFGNNNTYKWRDGNTIDWNGVVVNPDEKGNEQVINTDNLAEFTKRIINFRHKHKALHPNRYYEERDKNNYNGKEISFYDKFGNNVSEFSDDKKMEFFNTNGDWSDVIGVRLDETEFHDPAFKDEIKHPTIYIAYNRSKSPQQVKLPGNMLPGKKWYFAIDTSVPVTDPNDPKKAYNALKQIPAYKEGEEKPVGNHNIYIPERSMVVLVEK